jgi:hypothetical protein
VEYPPGWTCELVIVRLELYLLDRLSLSEALTVAEHIEACAGCAHRLVLLRVGSGEPAFTPPGEWPAGGRRG